MQRKFKIRIGWQEALPLLFFICLLFVGLTNYNQYGISWDEPMQRDMGLLSYDYVTGKSNELFNIQNKYHNATWEFINVLPEKLLNLKEGKQIYYSRHILNFLVFWLGAVFLYRLALLFTSDTWLSLLAVVILFLTPRIYAHGYYNSKDIPLLSFFIISMYYAIRFIQKPGWLNLLLLLLFSGALFGMRILGILVPCLTGVYVFLLILSDRSYLKYLKWVCLYFLLYPIAVYVLVPVLWPDPLFHLREAFAMMSHFPYEDPVLFQGQHIKPVDLPWYYVPVWIGISVPLLWVFLFISATIFSLLMFFYRPLSFIRKQPLTLLFLAWAWIPWLMVLLFHSHIYDEWRHLFFIYPAMILLMIGFLKESISLCKKQRKLIVFTFLGLFSWQSVVTLAFMIRNNPYQYVYFNPLAGKDIHLNYDMDYWGLSYRQAWDYLIYQFPVSPLYVQFETPPGEYNLAWFTKEELQKVHLTDYLSCQYFLTNYRFHPVYDYTEKIFSIHVDDLEIMTIFTTNQSNQR